MSRHWGPKYGGGHQRPPYRRLPACNTKRPATFWRNVEKTKIRQEFLAEESDSHPESRLIRTEAVLMVSRQPLTGRKLAQLAGLADATEARTLIRQLNDRYDRTGRAMRVEQIAGGFLMLTRPQVAPWLRRLQFLPGVVRLTSPVLETLAIVAYRQPVLRADVEAIRGSACGDILRQLMQRDLIRISGRSEELGRPFLYSTTSRFLQTFGLNSIDALPHADWFQPPAADKLIDDTTKSSEIPDSADKECKVSIRLAAALQETDFVDEFATGSSDASGFVIHNAPVAMEDDDEEFEDDVEEFEDEEDEFEEDEEEFADEEEDEEFEEEELDEEEWEEVEGEEDEEEEEDGDWDEDDYEEEDDEFEDDDVEEEEEEDDDWD